MYKKVNWIFVLVMIQFSAHMAEDVGREMAECKK